MKYSHMSQVFEWFKHPALYVSNFYPLYAPMVYKDILVLLLSDAVYTETHYSILTNTSTLLGMYSNTHTHINKLFLPKIFLTKKPFKD